MKVWLAARLRDWADRIDDEHATAVTSMTITCEAGEGWVLHQGFRGDAPMVGRGIPVRFLRHEYHRGHTEAARPI